MKKNLITIMYSLVMFSTLQTVNWPCEWPGCTQVSSRLSHLEKHMRTHTNDRPFSCTEKNKDGTPCKYAAKTLDARERHIRIHTGQKPYKCTEKNKDGTPCDYAARQSGTLLKHLRITHELKGKKEPSKIHTCEECGKSFKGKGAFNSHLVGHNKAKQKQSASLPVIINFGLKAAGPALPPAPAFILKESSVAEEAPQRSYSGSVLEPYINDHLIKES